MGKRKGQEQPGSNVKKKPGGVEKTDKRSRKKAFHNADFLNKCSVPLSNKFDALSEDKDEMEVEKKPKVTPIVVTTQPINIQAIAESVKVQCNIKIMSIGRKVFTETTDDKKKLQAAFDANKIDYFSYQEKSEKTFKIILSGLPEIETSIIKNELIAKHELTPTKITMFKTQAVSKLYLCEFASDVDNKKNKPRARHI